jgi:hypothetical protein
VSSPSSTQAHGGVPDESEAISRFLELLSDDVCAELAAICSDEYRLELLRSALAPVRATAASRSAAPTVNPRNRLASLDALHIATQYNVARDAATRVVGIPHLMNVVPKLDTIRDAMSDEMVEFLEARSDAGIRDELVLLPRVDLRSVPFDLLLRGYGEFRAAMDGTETADRPWFVEKGPWVRDEYRRQHNPPTHLADGRDPAWRVAFVLGDTHDPVSTYGTPAMVASGEPGLVFGALEPFAMLRALEQERKQHAANGVTIAELGPVGYVMAAAIRSLSGRPGLDEPCETTTMFSHYRNLRREDAGTLFPSAFCRDGRITFDEILSAQRRRVRPIGVRRVLEVM